MSFKLNTNLRVNSVVDVYASLLLHFSSRTSLSSFMLVPLPLRKSKFVANFNDKDLGVFAVEDNGSADWFILLQSGSQLQGIDFDKLRTVLLKFEKEFIALALPILQFLLSEYLIDVIVESLFCMVAEPAGVPQLFLREVDYKLAEHALEELSLFLHQLLQAALVKVPRSHCKMLIIPHSISFSLQSKGRILINSFFQNVDPPFKLILAFIMSLEQHTPTKTKCTCKCFFSSASTTEDPTCPKCHHPTKPVEKEEMPLLSPVTTPKSKVTPACKDLEYFTEEAVIPIRKEQQDKKRCFNCNKKVGLLGIQCKCGYVFCGGHRLPEKHQCDFDHKRLALDKLKMELKKVTKGKIEQI